MYEERCWTRQKIVSFQHLNKGVVLVSQVTRCTFCVCPAEYPQGPSPPLGNDPPELPSGEGPLETTTVRYSDSPGFLPYTSDYEAEDTTHLHQLDNGNGTCSLKRFWILLWEGCGVCVCEWEREAHNNHSHIGILRLASLKLFIMQIILPRLVEILEQQHLKLYSRLTYKHRCNIVWIC